MSGRWRSSSNPASASSAPNVSRRRIASSVPSTLSFRCRRNSAHGILRGSCASPQPAFKQNVIGRPASSLQRPHLRKSAGPSSSPKPQLRGQHLKPGCLRDHCIISRFEYFSQHSFSRQNEFPALPIRSSPRPSTPTKQPVLASLPTHSKNPSSRSQPMQALKAALLWPRFFR